jgi:SAM-dependent methyltransferase
MDLPTFLSLLSPQGQSALEAAAALNPKEADFLKHFEKLARLFPRELAREALAIAILRRGRGAAGKFGSDAEKMYITREALEQASSTEVSSWRAKRYEPYAVVADLGCSIGGDSLALARRARTGGRAFTIGVDRDRVRLAMATVNARALGLGNHSLFVAADLESPLPITSGPDTALFFDPSRRAGERKARSVSQYQPPLDVIQGWLPHWPALGVKLSPAVGTGELSGYDAELEFISYDGELKEAVLWFGPLSGGRGQRRATVLPGGHTMAGVSDLSGGATNPARISQPLGWLYEPDPAVIRAGLVRSLGAQLAAAQLDPDIAFLTSDAKIETPFARAFEIEDWMPFQLKRLRAYLRERGIGRVTVKKRGSPMDAERLARDLRTQGESHRLLVLTQCDDKPTAIICR